MGAQLYRRGRRYLRLERAESAVAGPFLCRRRQFARLRTGRGRAARYHFLRLARLQQVLCRIGSARRTAWAAQGTRHQRAGLHRFRQSVVERSEEPCPDAGPTRLDRRHPAEGTRLDRNARQRRRRRLVEIAGWPNPPRRGVPAQEGIVRQDPTLPCQFRYEVLMFSVRAGAAPLALLFALCGLLGVARAQQTPPAPAPAAAAP